MENKQAFQEWAIVELFGHNTIAGLVTEQTIGGTSFVRVDVPASDGKDGFTKLYGGAAIYAITPTTQEIAMCAAAKLRVRPVTPWVVPDTLKLQEPSLQRNLFDKIEDDDDQDDDI